MTVVNYQKHNASFAWLLAGVGMLSFARCAFCAPALTQMYHTAWTQRDGAPRAIQAMTATPDGFLWLASGDGLVRFDGQSFEHYQPISGDPFPKAFMIELRATDDGGLWIGYGGLGVSFLKRGHNHNYGITDGLASGSGVESIAIDKDGTVWITDNSNLKRLDGSEWRAPGSEWNLPEGLTPKGIYVDSVGTLWVASLKGAFYLRRGAHSFKRVEGLLDTHSVVASPSGTIWFRDGHNDTGPMRAVDPLSGTLRPDIASINVDAVYGIFSEDGALWLSTAHGIVKVQDPEKPRVVGESEEANIDYFQPSYGLSGTHAYSLTMDREGSVWAATNKGLDRFRPSAFISLPASSAGASDAIAAAGPGQIFVGGALMDVKSGKIVAPAPKSILACGLSYRDPHGDLWLGSDHGIWKYANGAFAAYPLPHDLRPYHPPLAMAMDSKGTLWASFVRNSLYKLSNDRWEVARELPDSHDAPATSIIFDSHERLWVSYPEPNWVQSLFEGQIHDFREKDGLDIGIPHVIAEIEGTILVGGNDGIDALIGSKFHHLRLSDDAGLQTVTGILRQKNGDVWISAVSGIVRLTTTELAKLQRDPAAEVQFTLYDSLDGIDSAPGQYLPRPSIVDGEDGNLYFKMSDGISLIDTAHPIRNVLPPAVVIDSISDGTHEYREWPTTTTFEPDTEKITIRYDASSLLIPQRVQFRYRLDGFDKEWQPGHIERAAIYSRLPPGSYTFRIIASNNDGVWNTDGASIRFIIPPSFTQSTGFKVLCVAVAGALLLSAYHIRAGQIATQTRRRLYERLDERTRIARDLHDTFFQAVQGLLLRFNMASLMLEKAEPARLVLEEALEQSDQVMLEGRKMMLDLRGSDNNETELADALSSIGENLKKACAGDLQVIVIGKARTLTPMVFDELRRFGHEALSNSFRHAQAKSIELELHYERHQFRLRVRDNGIGIPREALDTGGRAGHWGLPGMRERAKSMGGKLEIWSRETVGTEIELCIPSGAAYVSGEKIKGAPWLKQFRRKSNQEIP